MNSKNNDIIVKMVEANEKSPFVILQEEVEELKIKFRDIDRAFHEVLDMHTSILQFLTNSEIKIQFIDKSAD